MTRQLEEMKRDKVLLMSQQEATILNMNQTVEHMASNLRVCQDTLALCKIQVDAEPEHLSVAVMCPVWISNKLTYLMSRLQDGWKN